MDGIVSEVVVRIGLEVTVQEQQGWLNHEKGEGEMERDDTSASTFLQTRLEQCVYVHTHEKCEVCTECVCTGKMCARQVIVCTPPVVHTSVATTCVQSPKKLSEKTVERNKN